GALEELEDAHAEGLDLAGLLLRERRWDASVERGHALGAAALLGAPRSALRLAAAALVLLGERQQRLVLGADRLLEHAGARLVDVAEDRAVDLAQVPHGVLDDHHLVVAQRLLDASLEALAVAGERDADRRAEAGRLNDARIAQRLLDS